MSQSIGLHQRDNNRLIESMKNMRDLGNTLIVVEHDEDTMMQADYLIDIGPGAGELGGEIVAAGTPEQVMKNKKSLTGKYLSGKLFIPVPEKRRTEDKGAVKITGATENNLKNVDAAFPLGKIVAVTGVSGSGKSSLVNNVLKTALAKELTRTKEKPGKFKTISGFEGLEKVIDIDQSPIGRTPRSNPATYTSVFDDMRDLFASTNEAKIRGYKKGRFRLQRQGWALRSLPRRRHSQDRDAFPAGCLRALRSLSWHTLQFRNLGSAIQRQKHRPSLGYDD